MLKKKLEIFNILFEAIPEGVIIVDHNQRITSVNASAEKMFGYSKGELLHEFINILIPVKYQTTHKKHFSYFIKRNNQNYSRRGIYLFGIKKSGEEFPIQFSLNSFKFKNETYIMSLIIDMSKRKKAEEKIDSLKKQLEQKVIQKTAELNKTISQLKKINKNYKKEIRKRIEVETNMKLALKKEKELNDLKTKFLSMVSHEFKTPLSGILTSAILLEKYKLTEQQENRERHLNTITRKVHYLNNILNDFLSMERIDSSNIHYKFSSFNLSKVVNEVVYNANMLLKPGQKINIPHNSDDYIIYQDEKILELILSNLIHNAIKYSPKNTMINLEIEQNTTSIQFLIIDEGIGIPKNDQKFVFNRYFRSENVVNTPGTGIGLNIVKSHVENLDGSITFKSVENKGSVFKVELPLKQPNK